MEGSGDGLGEGVWVLNLILNMVTLKMNINVSRVLHLKCMRNLKQCNESHGEYISSLQLARYLCLSAFYLFCIGCVSGQQPLVNF